MLNYEWSCMHDFKIQPIQQVPKPELKGEMDSKRVIETSRTPSKPCPSALIILIRFICRLGYGCTKA